MSPDSLSEFHNRAQLLFDEAREQQKGENYSAAISAYQQLISLEPEDDDMKPVVALMDDGFLQLVYCYIFAGQRKDGADYFNRVYKEKKLWFVLNHPRSVEICTAYSLYEATRLEEAVALVDRALSREEEGRKMNNFMWTTELPPSFTIRLVKYVRRLVVENGVWRS